MTIETFTYLILLVAAFIAGWQTMQVRKYRNLLANADCDNIQLVLENEALKREMALFSEYRHDRKELVE